MQLLTEEYLNINKDLHDRNKHYGTSGKEYIKFVMQLCDTFKTKDVLDYGCGKSTLAHNLPFKIKQYDPAILKYAELPEPADLVVCTDVLEHVEPEFLDNVLDHLTSLTKKIAFFSIATCSSKKSLIDGRNAHLTVQPYHWWLPKLWSRFEIINLMNDVNNFIVVLSNLSPQARGKTTHINGQLNGGNHENEKH